MTSVKPVQWQCGQLAAEAARKVDRVQRMVLTPLDDSKITAIMVGEIVNLSRHQERTR